MKFAPILALAPLALAAPLGLRPTPVRRQEDAAASVDSASVDLAALAGVTVAAENAQATDVNVDNAILYNTIANNGLDGVETLSTELIAGVFSTETQSSTFVGADGTTTVVVALTASGVDTSIITLQTNNVVSGQFNVDFQQQFVEQLLNQLLQDLLFGQNNLNNLNLNQIDLNQLLAGGQLDLNDLINSGLIDVNQLLGVDNLNINDLLNSNLDINQLINNQNLDLNQLIASGLLDANQLNQLLGVNNNAFDAFNVNNAFNVNVDQQDLADIINQLVFLLVSDFNAVAAFGGVGINSVDVNGFQQFFENFAVGLGGFNNVNADALAQLVLLLQQLNGVQVVNFFGKQDQLFNANFLSQFGVNNDFDSFVNNFDQILGGLNGAAFDQDDLFALAALAQLIAAGQINLDQFNLFNAFGLNNNFGGQQNLDALLLALGVNNNNFNVNGFNNVNAFQNGFDQNDINNLLGLNANANLFNNGFNNNGLNNFNNNIDVNQLLGVNSAVNSVDLNSASNLNSLVAS